MNSRILSVIVVVLSVGLAGCQSGGPQNTGQTPVTTPETGTPAPTPTNTPTNTQTVTPTSTVTPGGTGSDTDMTTIASGHTTTLRQAGSFTVESSAEMVLTTGSSGETNRLTSDKVIRVDLQQNRAYERSEDTNPVSGGTSVSETYYDGTATHLRANEAGAATGTAPGLPPAWGVVALSDLAEVGTFSGGTGLQDVPLSMTGGGVHRGVHVTHYEFDATSVLDGDTFGLDDNIEVRSVTGRVYVDSAGLVRVTELSVSIADTTNDDVIDMTVVYEWTDVGKTAVSHPSWVSQPVTG